MDLSWTFHILNFDGGKAMDNQATMRKTKTFKWTNMGSNSTAIWLSVLIPKYSYERKCKLKCINRTKYLQIWWCVCKI